MLEPMGMHKAEFFFDFSTMDTIQPIDYAVHKSQYRQKSRNIYARLRSCDMNKDPYSRTAIGFGALKDALLYFDYAVPLIAPFEIAAEDIALKRTSSKQVDQEKAATLNALLNKLIMDGLPPELRTAEFIEQLHNSYKLSVPAMASLKESPANSKMENFRTSLKELTEKYNLHGLSICTLPSAIRPGQEPEDIAINIAALRLIDTEKTSFEQILELRSDNEAKKKLKRLRLFAYENYQGKPRSFIEDDLANRIVDYELAVKKCGFETKAAAMTALLDSKLLAGGIVGSFLATYINQPLITIAAAAGAAGIALGKIAIEVGKKRFELQKIMAESPVSYITYAKDKLGSKET